MADQTQQQPHSHPAGLGVPAGFEDLTFVDPQDIAQKLSSDDKQGVVVIDVREDHEYSAGHIAQAENVPSGKFTDEAFLQGVIADHKDAKTIVVHCMKSQHRGPTCGRALNQALEKYAAEHPSESLPSM